MHRYTAEVRGDRSIYSTWPRPYSFCLKDDSKPSHRVKPVTNWDHHSYIMLHKRQRSLRYFMPPRPGGASLLRRTRLRRGGYLPDDFPTAESLAGAADHKLFVSIAGKPHHVLRRSYHEKKSSGHNLRTRAHNFLLSEKDDRNFVSRSIYAELKA